MSKFNVNNITGKQGQQGPVLAGVTTMSSTGSMRIPSGPTEQRGGRGRAVRCGGRISPSNRSEMDFVEIATTGNATDFGDLSAGAGSGGVMSSSTRGVVVMAWSPNVPSYSAAMEYITYSSSGGVSDFGDIKTAIAKENNEIKYEVVYIDMKDPLENNSGTAIASSVTLRDDIAKPVLGPRASTSQTTTDRDVYEITTDGGLSFSTSGSKVRYANQLSADLDFITTLYPNAIANLRSRMKSLGHKEWAYLPLWMRTTQSLSKAPLGFVKAVPICYCKPGTSGLIKKRITDKNLTFKNIHFIIDRYQVSNSKVSTNTFTGDGSTKTFVLGEIVHDDPTEQGGGGKGGGGGEEAEEEHQEEEDEEEEEEEVEETPIEASVASQLKLRSLL